MKLSQLRLLLVGLEKELGDAVSSAFSDSRRFDVKTAVAIDSLCTEIRSQRIDAVIVALPSAIGENGLLPLRTVHSLAPWLPLLLVVDPAQPDVTARAVHLVRYEVLSRDLVSSLCGPRLLRRWLQREIGRMNRHRPVTRRQEFFSSVLDSICSSIAVIDARGEIVAVNDSWQRLTTANGATCGPGVGSEYLSVCNATVHMKTAETGAIATAIRSILRCELEQFYLEYRCDSAEPRWYGVRLSRHQEPSGERYVVAMHEDVTARRLAGAELSRHAAVAQSLIEGMNEGAIACDADGRLILFNSAAEEILGMGPTSRDVSDWPRHFGIYPPGGIEPVPTIQFPLWNAVQGETTYGRIFQVCNEHRPDPIDIRMDAFPLHDEQRELRGGLIVFENVTALRRTERILKRRESLHAWNREWSDKVGHGLANQLQSIIGYSKLAQRGLPMTAPNVDYVEKASAAAQRATMLCRQLVNIGRQQQAELAPVDLRSLIERALDSVRAILDEEIEVRLSFRCSQNVVAGDADLLEDALVSICLFVGRCLQKKGRLSVMVGQIQAAGDAGLRLEGLEPGPHFEIAVVADSLGTGLRPAKIAAADDGELLLSDVASVFRQHQGAGGLVPHGEGERCYRFYLPARITPLISAADTSAALGGLESILVVDDDSNVRNFIRKALTDVGYSVFTAYDGRQALEAFECFQHEIDLVVLDMSLPEIDGRTVGERLRSMRPELPLLVASGFPTDAGRLWAGANARSLSKPFTVEDLLGTVRSMLDMSQEKSNASSS